MTRVGCVVLTLGDRRRELRRAVDSVVSQQDVEVDAVVVVNGTMPAGELPGVRVVELGHNAGISAGRNEGLRRVTGELVLFLDDDAWLAGADVLSRAAARFAADRRLGVLSLRVVDPDGRPPQRRHVPRLRAGDPARSSQVTTFLGGASVVRREVFDRVGGFPEAFRYAHEETSLAWRAIDAGYRLWYAGDLIVHHPAVEPSHHDEFHYLTARNRVLLARMHLPLVVAALYLTTWALLSLARFPDHWRPTLRGFVDGAGLRGVTRRPIGWRTVWRLTRAGRPPIV